MDEDLLLKELVQVVLLNACVHVCMPFSHTCVP